MTPCNYLTPVDDPQVEIRILAKARGKVKGWHSVVYGKDVGTVKSPKEWDSVRRQVIRRDRQKCQRCEQWLPYPEASVHHIKPRSEGGSEQLPNLILLCTPCHDLVECQKPPLRSKAAIVGSSTEAVPYVYLRPRRITGNDWRMWVYGAERPPL